MNVPSYLASAVHNISDGKIDIRGKYLSVNLEKLLHEINRHSNSADELAKKQIPYDANSVADLLVETFSEPTFVENATTKSAKDQRDTFVLCKEKDGYFVLVEAVGGKHNPNIVPEQILYFTKEKFDDSVKNGMSLSDMIYPNTGKDKVIKEGKKIELLWRTNRKKRKGKTSETTPHSPLMRMQHKAILSSIGLLLLMKLMTQAMLKIRLFRRRRHSEEAIRRVQLLKCHSITQIL